MIQVPGRKEGERDATCVLPHVRAFAVALVVAPPERVPRDVHHWRPTREAGRVVLRVPLVVLGAQHGTRTPPRQVQERAVERGGHVDVLRLLDYDAAVALLSVDCGRSGVWCVGEVGL